MGASLTIRSRVEPGGWQANSVAVAVVDWSMIHNASGFTISMRLTMYTYCPASVVRTISSPASSLSTLRKSLLWLTRWPAITELPIAPGCAVPGQWPGP
jgi:hypothetical protein